MPEPLTAQERRVYHYLIDFLAENTFQPSIRDIARHFHIKSTKTVSDLLLSLAAKGYIERDESRSRGVRLLGFAGGGATQPVPCYERLPSGTQALRAEHRTSWVTVDRRFLPNDDVFFVRVRADGTATHGIHDADLVLVGPTLPPNDGDLVVAKLGVDAVVRIARVGAGRTLLVASTVPDRAREVGHQDDALLLGLVCGVFRPFHDGGAARPDPRGERGD